MFQMEIYLNADILSHILKYLDKDSSFDFLNIATFMIKYRQMLYDKYLFCDDRIMNREICKRIKKVICETPNNVNKYTNLILLIIDGCGTFNDPLINLPSTIQSIKIFSDEFNQTLDYLPKSLLSLDILYRNTFSKAQFNQPINNLPKTLKSLYIDIDNFNQSLDYLPNDLQKLKIKNTLQFNQPIDKLPRSLISLELLYCDAFDQSINNLPENLQSLMIHHCVKFNQKINKLPQNLKSLRITECGLFDYSQLCDVIPESFERKIW